MWFARRGGCGPWTPAVVYPISILGLGFSGREFQVTANTPIYVPHFGRDDETTPAATESPIAHPQ